MNKRVSIDGVVVVALGCSLAGDFGTRQALLEAAVSAFPNVGMVVRKLSRWWKSEAWPDPSEPWYLNGVALVETALPARAVLIALHSIEDGFGRSRTTRNAPRTLDLDLVAYGRTVSDDPGLHLPHPRALQRLFVTGPLAEIAPEWTDPAGGMTAGALAASASVGLDARPL